MFKVHGGNHQPLTTTTFLKLVLSQTNLLGQRQHFMTDLLDDIFILIYLAISMFIKGHLALKNKNIESTRNAEYTLEVLFSK